MSQALRALIVDDEFHARENLRMLIEEFCPELEVVGLADGPKQAQEQIEALNPDVLFLDIRMPSGAEGFDLIEAIENPKFQVVFVTAFKDYAIRAFQTNAVHYILKPIDIDDLLSATKKLLEYAQFFHQDKSAFDTYFEGVKRVPNAASENQTRTPERLTLFHSKGFRIAKTKEIVRLEAAGNCTLIHFEDGSSYIDTKTLKTFEELLGNQDFCRIHKSHIIQLNHLVAYDNQDGASAEMSNGDHVPIARARLQHFLKRVKEA
ncbi:MAG: LytTR family DNA-binding domain-containing protein [Flavobacteriales bacterium]|nr:LytTR family DNA-binding domain-containing protein [Flavobacteriales bacterium]